MKPTRLTLALLLALLLAAVLIESLPLLDIQRPELLLQGWQLALGVLLLLTLADLLLALRQPLPQVSRELPSSLSLGRQSQVQLTLQRNGSWPRWLEVFDHVPEVLDFRRLPHRIRPQASAREISLSYPIVPRRRGHCGYQHCELTLPGPLGLWQLRKLLPLEGSSRIYPDFTQLHGTELASVEHWLGRLGIRQVQRRGDSLEFMQLREFRHGDSLRHVDWKATARLRTPITREYCEERDQQLILLIDGGRHMQGRDGKLSHFDHALNASLLLAHVALRQGDAVGVLSFATDRPCFMPPRKGPAQLNALLNALHDLQPGPLPGDFLGAASELLTRQKRRALVIMISNLHDDDDDQLPIATARLIRHHRLLIASLQETGIDERSVQPVQSYADALDYCGALDYRLTRQQLHQRLRAQGIPLLDTAPASLGPELINRYLQWKAAGSL